jgi:nucleoside recognition membrane protein YjiH
MVCLEEVDRKRKFYIPSFFGVFLFSAKFHILNHQIWISFDLTLSQHYSSSLLVELWIEEIGSGIIIPVWIQHGYPLPYIYDIW